MVKVPFEPGDHIWHSPGDTHFCFDRRYWIGDRGFPVLRNEAQNLQFSYDIVAGPRARPSADGTRLVGDGPILPARLISWPADQQGHKKSDPRDHAQDWHESKIDLEQLADPAHNKKESDRNPESLQFQGEIFPRHLCSDGNPR